MIGSSPWKLHFGRTEFRDKISSVWRDKNHLKFMSGCLNTTVKVIWIVWKFRSGLISSIVSEQVVPIWNVLLVQLKFLSGVAYDVLGPMCLRFFLKELSTVSTTVLKTKVKSAILKKRRNLQRKKQCSPTHHWNVLQQRSANNDPRITGGPWGLLFSRRRVAS